MTNHLPNLYTQELNRLRAELILLNRVLIVNNIPAEEREICSKHLAAALTTLRELKKAVNLTHDYYRAACADRDATHAELRDALTRLRDLTAAATLRHKATALRLLAAATLGALITFLILTA